ncbi:N-acetylglucosamine kinase [Actinocrinis sp.]|uniref:N-acetylglucosamine kinase n=1 Tax=Actinocrinis sp. TaxID=1920516 RepID=UPI002BBC1BB7|nr:BadF/BadG/BcrA/BcrD ATPase family protein [Actinocrinis sp.]HXR71187.1 BadF/BadG/BcrA/BcrD ATPase family protein [Actinocrinis sp.]
MTVSTNQTESAGGAGEQMARAGTVLAIDGGNSKTDVLLVDDEGKVIASARSGGFTPQSSGVAAAIAVAAQAVAVIRTELGLDHSEPLARHLAAYVAGADLPVEEEALAVAFAAEGWADTVEVGNDTFALLRAGASRPWGVAVVCGAGVNCAGIGPDGTRARFPALGRISGDWGGGHHLGEEALWHAIRGEDGRGPRTALTEAVAEHFERPSAEAVALALHFGEVSSERLNELAPVLLAVAAEGDPVALAVTDRMAEEIVTLARVVLVRLGIADRAGEVVLGGGVLRARVPVLMDRIAARAAAEIPLAELVVVEEPPVVGAALLGLEALGLTGVVRS